MYGRKGTTARPSCHRVRISSCTVLYCLTLLLGKAEEERKRGDTYTDRSPSPHEHVLIVLHHSPGVLDHRVDRERRQTHTCDALEHGPLDHYHAVVLDEGDAGCRPRGELSTGAGTAHVACCHAPDDLVGREVLGVFVGLAGWGEDVPVAQVGLVAFVGDIAEQIGPGDAVGGAHEVGVCDGAEGLAYVGGVGDIAVGGQEDGANAVDVTGVSVRGVG
jgi:hypothetical protein